MISGGKADCSDDLELEGRAKDDEDEASCTSTQRIDDGGAGRMCGGTRIRRRGSVKIQVSAMHWTGFVDSAELLV